MNTLQARLLRPARRAARRPGRRSVLALALASLFAPAVAAQAEAPAVGALLERANAALGWDRVVAHPGTVRVTGAARTRGTHALQTERFDGRGRWLQTFEGPLPGQGGFDGETYWSVDWTGTPRRLDLGDRIASRMSAAFLYGSWAAPDSGLEFTAVSDSDGGWALEFTPIDGFARGTVLLDRDTSLPRTVRWETSGQESVWTFAGYTDHDGYRFPARLTLEQAGVVQGLETSAVEFLPAADDALFAPRLERPDDTRFTPDAPAQLELRQAPTGHLLVHPRIDGQDLGWFIFDTGAGTNCISNSVVDRLGGEPFGEVPAKGVGGTVLSRFWRAGALELGPVTIADPIFIGLDLEFLNAPFGVEVGGIIGYELLARCTVEFDLEAPYIALFDPEHYELEGGTWTEVLLDGRLPCVRASLEGREGVFKLDTGAAGDTITVHSPAVRELGLLEGRTTRAGRAGGVGGQVPVRDGNLESFELGGHQFGAIPASFATTDEGVFANPYVWGNLGGRVMSPFLLVFDYPHRRLGFVLK